MTETVLFYFVIEAQHQYLLYLFTHNKLRQQFTLHIM